MQQYNRLSADVPHLLSLARARLTPLEMASGEYEQGSKGSRELPKLQRTSQSVHQSTSDGVAGAREQLESS